MRIGLSLSCSTVLVPDCFASVFPKTEKYVNELDGRVVKQLKAGLDKSKYKSLVDRIFCSAYPEMKGHCQNYYRGRGPRLDKQLSKPLLKKIDKFLKAWIKLQTSH